ncbi:hypothetical protein EIP91_003693 [Steccherinum ochraceum]|uniref:DUF218 domain-containing protein n=1 Tax=Steccherinum ochraceum TaxID=92696 RepID=A0A4V2MW36_9APHY|nr:hypothetical protein EIP91_003693 [Steccherinum ochraceum]
MLPTPISARFSQRSPKLGGGITASTAYHRHGRSRARLDVLLTRARVTNLGLILLGSFAALSFLVNLSYYLSSSCAPGVVAFGHPPGSILDTIEREDEVKGLSHLILVPGHGIWKGWNEEEKLDEEKWVLEQYQLGGGRVSAWVKHIETGAELALQDENSLLVFSGGQTRRNSTTTEGESYLRLASQTGMFKPNHRGISDLEPFRRATTENYALDSFQNLLFAIARFHEYTGRYPELITVVGYEMKRKRFTDLHRAALRWPADRFHYIGIDPEKEAPSARNGERQNGYLPYTRDTYGCHDELQQKRRSRNPFFRYHSYYTSSPDLTGLFDWCPGTPEGGPTVLYPGQLPWHKPR